MEVNDLILSDEALKVIDEGTWVDDLESAPGVRLLVTGLQSEAAQKLMREKQASLRSKNRGRPLNEKQLSQCTKEVLVDVVLKGWEGLKSNGEEVEYSQAQARSWIMSRNGERFTALVLEAAHRVDTQAAEYAKELEKN